MFEFNAESILFGQYSFSESKNSSRNKHFHQNGIFYLNFARAINSRVQVGLQTTYFKSSNDRADTEGYSGLIGGTFNFREGNFTNSEYLSLYAGFEWSNVYSESLPNTREESLVSKFSMGKRYPVAFISENFTYSPEVTFKSRNPTRSSEIEWKQEIIIKFLQFAVFF
jgi:hypothetical protein